MRREVPFQPEGMLMQLYSLEQIVQGCASGGSGAGGLGQAPTAAARFSADDAAAGFHEWQEQSGESGRQAGRGMPVVC